MYLLYSLIGSCLAFGIANGRYLELVRLAERAAERAFLQGAESLDLFSLKSLRGAGRWAVVRDLSICWFLGTLVGFVVLAFS